MIVPKLFMCNGCYHDANRNGRLTAILRDRLSEGSEHVARECTLLRLHQVPTSIFKGTEELSETNSWIVGHDVAYAMTWTELKKKMTDKYCPRNEMKKLEADVVNLKSDKVERYVGGLPDMIHGSVVASKQKPCRKLLKWQQS
ncbi:hypothetical protein Tco_0421285 [Tanacetum coccineum]